MDAAGLDAYDMAAGGDNLGGALLSLRHHLRQHLRRAFIVRIPKEHPFASGLGRAPVARDSGAAVLLLDDAKTRIFPRIFLQNALASVRAAVIDTDYLDRLKRLRRIAVQTGSQPGLSIVNRHDDGRNDALLSILLFLFHSFTFPERNRS